eukprot:scaffold17415_cov147-Isochrysis_galbana.AAC.2
MGCPPAGWKDCWTPDVWTPPYIPDCCTLPTPYTAACGTCDRAVGRACAVCMATAGAPVVAEAKGRAATAIDEAACGSLAFPAPSLSSSLCVRR